MEANIEGIKMVPANEIKAGDILIQRNPKNGTEMIEVPVIAARMEPGGKLRITVKIRPEHRATPAVTDTDRKDIFIPAEHANSNLPVKA